MIQDIDSWLQEVEDDKAFNEIAKEENRRSAEEWLGIRIMEL